MFSRIYSLPKRNFFLFGPRGTGKTTWLKQMLPNAKWFNLLRTTEILALSRDPELFRKEIEALSTGSWVVVDEVQRLPSLLNEVHALIADRGSDFRFALTGSSARKLKRSNVNLLAGRAINRSFYPLTAAELGEEFDLDEILRFGCLPQIRQELSNGAKESDLYLTLEAYVDTYLRQEIKEEALVKRLEPFARFMEIAALTHAQVTNLASLARDTGISRPTIQGYFDVLVDTLIGSFLPPWKPKARVKEISHPKFYFFDTGVARALAGKHREPLDSTERGHLLEGYLYHELRTWSHVHDSGGAFSYWRTPSGSEVDFIFARGKKSKGIEIKSSRIWKPAFSNSLRSLYEDKKIQEGFGVYLGDRVLKDGPLEIMPLKFFLKTLENGSFFH